MSFVECIKTHASILMEGALGERLKREYNIRFDKYIDMGGLVYTKAGRIALEKLWNEYATIADKYNLPFLATTPTRRTNSERMAHTNFPDEIIKDNVEFLRQIQQKQNANMYIGGLIGCHGDAYTGNGALNIEEARIFHTWEVKKFADAKVDFLYAALIPTLEEAIGIALAIEPYQVPYIISFTIDKTGCLIDGTLISDAIKYIDEATYFEPVCYMTNCVHPRILHKALENPKNNTRNVEERFLGIQANTSILSYGELDDSAKLHTTSPVSLAEEMISLRNLTPIKIFGGYCGTNNLHLEEIAKRI